MSKDELPVLIVGGGAAGTVLSLELARHGVKYRCIDRLDEPAKTSKAITIHARTAELFDRIDQRLIDRYLGRAIHNKGYVLHFVDDEGKRTEVRPGIDFTSIDSSYPYIFVHGQSETEAVIREYLLSEFGLSTEWGTQCTSVRNTNNGAVAELRNGDGNIETVHCRYLVACDGMNSFVREALKLSQDESDYAGAKMQNMDVFLKNFPDVDDYVHYCAGTNHFIMIVKLPGGFHRLLLSDRGEAADPSVTAEQAFMRLIDQHFDGVSLGEIVWHSRWESWQRLATTYRAGNVFLAGDAAHVHSTTGGQGMNCCMQDAFNLGWKLGFVLNGLAADNFLDSYEVERRPIAEQVIWAASSLHKIFMGHGKDINERAKMIDDPEFLDAVVGRCSGIAYTYRNESSETTGLPGPQPGDRMPDLRFANGERLFACSRHTQFTLLATHTDTQASDELTTAIEQIRNAHPNTTRSFMQQATNEFHKIFGSADEENLLLVRPDGYIAARGTANAWRSINKYLTELASN